MDSWEEMREQTADDGESGWHERMHRLAAGLAHLHFLIGGGLCIAALLAEAAYVCYTKPHRCFRIS